MARDRIDSELFKKCESSNRKQGGRIAIDKAVRHVLLDAHSTDPSFPRLIDKKFFVEVGSNKIDIKSDCSLQVADTDKCIFIEIKGYGTDTNSLNSAILVALIAKKFDSSGKFTNALFYYLGGSNSSEFEKGRTVPSLVGFARSQKLIDGFFGFGEIDKLLENIKERATDPHD